MLAWSIIDFPQAYQAAGEYKKYLKELKWGTDFLIKAHLSEFEMVGLIGSPNADHKQWVRPDDPDAARTPSFTISKVKSRTFLSLFTSSKKLKNELKQRRNQAVN